MWKLSILETCFSCEIFAFSCLVLIIQIRIDIKDTYVYPIMLLTIRGGIRARTLKNELNHPANCSFQHQNSILNHYTL